MDSATKQRLATAKNKVASITELISTLDPENPIHAGYLASLSKSLEMYERQIAALESLPDTPAS